jgi:hypothetical protein
MRLFYEGGSMSTLQLLDAAGRRRSPATLPGYHAGRPPRNKGFRYPPDPPRVEEIIAVMRRLRVSLGLGGHRANGSAGPDRLNYLGCNGERPLHRR